MHFELVYLVSFDFYLAICICFICKVYQVYFSLLEWFLLLQRAYFTPNIGPNSWPQRAHFQ